MGKIVVRDAVVSDVIAVAQNLRHADYEEMQNTFGQNVNPVEICLASFDVTPRAYAVEADGETIAVFGVSPVPDNDVGIPWFLGTPETVKYPKKFVEVGKQVVKDSLNEFSLLFNYVDVNNTASKRWLERIGFDIGPAVPFGQYRMPFYLFTAQRSGIHGKQQPS